MKTRNMYYRSLLDAGSYSKVLIVGESFHTHSGGGITQSNLFKFWPQDKIAIIPYEKGVSDPLVCNKIYSLNEKEIKYLFPFNLLNKISQHTNRYLNKIQDSNLISKLSQDDELNSKLGSQVIAQRARTLSDVNIQLKTIKTLKTIYGHISGFFGIDHIKSKIVISSELLNWIDEFKPDLIYAQFATLDKIRFVYNLKRETNIPLVIHFMDDWPSVLVSPGIFHNYWKKIINKELRSLIDSADACIAISKKMADEFKIRYNRNFSYYHNPVDVDDWLPYSKTSWDAGSSFKILYAGRGGKSILKSIKTIAQSIQKLNNKYEKIEFHIYTKDFTEVELLFSKMSAIYVHKPIPDYDQIPQLFCSYDLLVLPLDFDSKFLTLSMPTKVSEYMISGTPTLIFAPKNTALTEYAMNYQWGYVISNNEESEIEIAILDFVHNESTRRKYGLKAKEIAIERHNSDKVRLDFRKLLNSQIKIEGGM